MPTTLIVTPGAADANSWASYTEYQAYWANRLFNTVASGATQPVAETAMKWACLLMSSLFNWTGSAVDDVQALPWPRNGMLSLTGFPIPNTVNPVQLKNAQCEYAGILLSGDRTKDNPALKVMGSETAVSSLKVGPVAFSFNNATFSSLEAFDAYIRSLGADFQYLSKAMPDSVRALLPPSWYVQAQLKRPVLFATFGSRGSDC